MYAQSKYTRNSLKPATSTVSQYYSKVGSVLMFVDLLLSPLRDRKQTWDHRNGACVCVRACVCVFHFELWIKRVSFTKLPVYVMSLDPTSLLQFFTHRSHNLHDVRVNVKRNFRSEEIRTKSYARIRGKHVQTGLHLLWGNLKLYCIFIDRTRESTKYWIQVFCIGQVTENGCHYIYSGFLLAVVCVRALI
jgi:hypothetical protein